MRDERVSPSAGGSDPKPAQRIDPVKAVFVDVAAASGIVFTHEADAAGEYRLPEEMGSGGAFIDYDDDGDLDIYLVQGGKVVGANLDYRNKLYRNDGGRFTDVSAGSGADVPGYGMGCAAADIDNDGDTDLYVTRLGPNVLLRNDGGRFTDITGSAGVGDPGFGEGAAFVDYDRDGLLDLYVVNYVEWSADEEHACYDPAGDRDYCSPISYPPAQHRLYRNLGGGRFEDATDASGVGAHKGNGLGILCTDVDGDGWVDIFVANDQTPGFLWINRKDGTFEEAGAIRGCAYNSDGLAIAGMGTAAEDFDHDGDYDLVVMNIRDQAHLCLRNDGGFFTDMTHAWGFGGWSMPSTAFGIALFDQDHDGRLDGFIANGAVNRRITSERSDRPFAEPNQFIRRGADGRFRDASGEAGLPIEPVQMSRGAIMGDYDNDGDIDILVTNNRGPARLLRNEQAGANAWAMFDLTPASGARHALNARVEIVAGSEQYLREVRPHVGYLGSNDPRVHVGLGGATTIDRATVTWPGGGRESWADLPVSKHVRLREGASPSFEVLAPDRSGQ